MRWWLGWAVLGTACGFATGGVGDTNVGPASGDSTSGDPAATGPGPQPDNPTTAGSGSGGTTAPSPSTTDPPSDGTETTAVETSGTSGEADADDWWDPAYAQRVRLRIDESNEGPLPAGYTVVLLGYDWQGHIDAGELLDRGQDIRIVRHAGGTMEELHRRAIRLGVAGGSEIWFKTIDEIDGSTEQYYAYFDNPDAPTPPQSWSDSMGADDPSEIYLAADSFQGHDAGDCPNGWGDCGFEWSVAENGGNRYLESTGDGLYLLAGDPSWGDVWVEARVASLNPDGCPGIASRAQDSGTLLYAGYGCDNSTVPADTISAWVRDGGYTPIIWADQPLASQQWARIATAWTGNTVRLFHNGQQVGSASAIGAQPSGRAGLFSTYGTVLWADDVIVRRYVDPEPKVSALAVETQP